MFADKLLPINQRVADELNSAYPDSDSTVGLNPGHPCISIPANYCTK